MALTLEQKLTNPHHFNLTTQDVVLLFDLHENTVLKRAASGKIPARKMGRDWRFSYERLEAWSEAQTREVRVIQRRKARLSHSLNEQE